MYDLISIGTISVDLFFDASLLTQHKNRYELAIGGKYQVHSCTQKIGGGGMNVAIHASRSNLHTAVLGIVGRNMFKKVITEEFKENSISEHLIQFSDDYMNISTILLNSCGERTIIHYSPKHQKIEVDDHTKSTLLHSQSVYLGNFPDVSFTQRVQILKMCRSHNVWTTVNIGTADCKRDKNQILSLFTYANCVILNEFEFADCAKVPHADINFKDNIIGWYFPQLMDKLIVVTRGSKGSHAYINGVSYHMPAKKVVVRDTTGAGDAFTAGFIASYLKERSIESALYQGTMKASKILSIVGSH